MEQICDVIKDVRAITDEKAAKEVSKKYDKKLKDALQQVKYVINPEWLYKLW